MGGREKLNVSYRVLKELIGFAINLLFLLYDVAVQYFLMQSPL